MEAIIVQMRASLVFLLCGRNFESRLFQIGKVRDFKKAKHSGIKGEESVNWLCVLRGDVCVEEVISMPFELFLPHIAAQQATVLLDVFAGSIFLRFLVVSSAIRKIEFPQIYVYRKKFLREYLLHCRNYTYKKPEC